MKKIIACALLALTFISAGARADIGSAYVIINGATSNVSSAVVATDRSSFMRAQVYSTSGSSGIVTLRQRANSNAPWEVVATITDPTGPDSDGNGGEYWVLPIGMQFQATITGYASGTIFVILETHQISN